MTTCRPSAASARASGWCIRRGISCPCRSTTQPVAGAVLGVLQAVPPAGVDEELPDPLGDQHVAQSSRRARSVRWNCALVTTCPTSSATTTPCPDRWPTPTRSAPSPCSSPTRARVAVLRPAAARADRARHRRRRTPPVRRQVELGSPRNIEWVDETTPSLLPAVRRASAWPRPPARRGARGVPPARAAPDDGDGRGRRASTGARAGRPGPGPR